MQQCLAINGRALRAVTTPKAWACRCGCTSTVSAPTTSEMKLRRFLCYATRPLRCATSQQTATFLGRPGSVCRIDPVTAPDLSTTLHCHLGRPRVETHSAR